VSKYSNRDERDGRMLLNSIHGLGPIILSRLLDSFEHCPWKILTSTKSELIKVKGVGEKACEAIINASSSNWLEKEKEKLANLGGRFLFDSEISENLKELNDTPIGLYCLGEVPPLPCLSIVGTRVPSMYGKRMARKIASELANAGICVVSGMARGIDSEAHAGAIEAGGHTVAFLGSGLDIIYPPENLELYRKIISSGAVLSEFPLGRRADRRTFPMRNRLVAGVSLGVLVVESASSGGSMITAKFAAEQGRSVFALPGRVDQAESQGCLDLIRDGATLVRNASDIIEEIAPMIPHKTMSTDKSFIKLTNGDYSFLSQDEQLIVRCLSEGDSYAIDKLHILTKLPLSQIMSSLTMLEIRGIVAKRADGLYESTGYPPKN
jgi:DNA processing protein